MNLLLTNWQLSLVGVQTCAAVNLLWNILVHVLRLNIELPVSILRLIVAGLLFTRLFHQPPSIRLSHSASQLSLFSAFSSLPILFLQNQNSFCLTTKMPPLQRSSLYTASFETKSPTIHFSIWQTSPSYFLASFRPPSAQQYRRARTIFF